jgi:hypothetical protein
MGDALDFELNFRQAGGRHGIENALANRSAGFSRNEIAG